MKQVLIRQGAVVVEEVPAPPVEPGRLLVRVVRSCISAGTELSGIRASGVPMWRQALRDPAKVGRVLDMARSGGLRRARSFVAERLAAGRPTGYSLAGTVLAVGAGVADLRPGDRVACAGNQHAHHAELVSVPSNLAVAVPEALDWDEASTVTLGAIALQAVRRAAPTLGETFVVLGLGILGQLAAQLLRANGCRVIGTDPDRGRLDLAVALGMDRAVHPDDGPDIEAVARLTGGIGADGVIVAAATPSNAVMSTAFAMCRKKGRVVLLGDVGLALNRADFYEKELDFLISTSYGPGRYDRRYEEEGADYPVAYVRWTENRNMAAYLSLLAEGRVRVAPLISQRFGLADAPAAYRSLEPGPDGAARPLIVLLDYPEDAALPPRRVVRLDRPVAPVAGTVGLALIGAGAFARQTHLPNLRALADRVTLRAVVGRNGASARETARLYGAAYAATDIDAVLADPEIQAVLIATRHDSHGRLALAALAAGKHVLVEKPLALSEPELAAIEAFYAEAAAPKPLLLTGFNRRFSPIVGRIQAVLAGRATPLIANYRMNAGYVPPDHWVHGPEGGGRNLGEACHVYDLFTALTGARVTAVAAQAIAPAGGPYGPSDNFVATVSFDDGSVASLTYTALGHPGHPKEHLEIYADGKVLAMEDYRRLTVHGAKGRDLAAKVQDKGHRAELAAFLAAIRDGAAWPIPLWQQLQAMRIALAVEACIAPASH